MASMPVRHDNLHLTRRVIDHHPRIVKIGHFLFSDSWNIVLKNIWWDILTDSKGKKKNLKFSVCTSQSIAAPVDWSRMWMWHVHYQERSRNTGGGHLLNSISLMAWPCSPLPSMVFFLFFLGACTATSSVSSCFCFPGGWSAWPLGPCPPEHLKGTTVPSKALPALSYCLIIIPI